MAVLQWGLVLFFAAFLIHLVIWRIHKPALALRALLVIFLAIISTGLVAAYFFGSLVRSIGLAELPSVAAYLHVLLFSVSMALAYIAGNVVLEWDSPSPAIVRLVVRAGEKGIEAAELIRIAENMQFIEDRIQSLIRGNIIVENEGRFIISPGRHFFLHAILFYSRLVRRDDTQTG
jgi:hypothetical protein